MSSSTKKPNIYERTNVIVWKEGVDEKNIMYTCLSKLIWWKDPYVNIIQMFILQRYPNVIGASNHAIQMISKCYPNISHMQNVSLSLFHVSTQEPFIPNSDVSWPSERSSTNRLTRVSSLHSIRQRLGPYFIIFNFSSSRTLSFSSSRLLQNSVGLGGEFRSRK